MSLNSFKRRTGVLFNKTFVRPVLEMLNLLFFHWNDRMHWKSKTNNQARDTCLIIRPETNTQGLLSSYLYVMKNVRYAIENGYECYVDFESDKCQYYTGRKINNSFNAWEYYFKQPCNLNKEAAFRYSNILLSGWEMRKKGREKVKPIPKVPSAIINDEITWIFSEFGAVQEYISVIVDKKYNELFSGKVLGVFLRGTDYIKLRPKGHAIQPTIEEAKRKINEFLNCYHIDRIFVVTEDASYYKELQNSFGDIVFSSDEYFVENYSEKGYVASAFTNDAYERGLNYLIRILLIGRCDYLISGVTNGSLVARGLKQGGYEDEYWFELGEY